MALGDLIEDAASPHARPDVTLEIRRDPGDDTPEPQLLRTPEIVHGLGNFLANALQFAYGRVTVTVAWTAREVTVLVVDDGPGFPLPLLGRLGEPYLSGRSGDTAHMGPGSFTAQTLPELPGAAGASVNGTEELGMRTCRERVDP